MAINNDGNLVDTSGNVAVDFVWGNFPMQPNDDRTDGTSVAVVAANASENKQWSGYSVYPSARLNASYDSHAIAEAEWANYPSFIAAEPNYMISAVSGDGTTVTYTCQNYYNGGETVNITGLTASAYNLSGVTIASGTRTSFTVTNSANVGLITGQRGKVESTTALTAADGAGIAYINVPAVLGKTTALALDALLDAGYEAASITTASAATNTAIAITAAARTGASSTATVTATGAGAAFPVGAKITIAGLADATTTELNGTWTVTANATNTVSFVSNATTAIAVASPTGTPTVKGTTGTIKTQSTAASTASVATTATITITPFA